MPHRHEFIERGRAPVTLIRSSCACGAHKFEFEHAGRRFGLALGMSAGKAAKQTRQAMQIGTEAVGLMQQLGALWQRIRQVTG